jgi:hypothetical protein
MTAAIDIDGQEAWQSGDEADGFEELASRIQDRLKSGGPAVDFAAIHLYIAGDLDVAEERRVRELVVTWESWNQAYWETMLALAKGDTSGSRDECGGLTTGD